MNEPKYHFAVPEARTLIPSENPQLDKRNI